MRALSLRILFGALVVLALGASVCAAQTTCRVHVTGESNSVYRIMARTNLVSGAWTAIRAGILENTETDVELQLRSELFYCKAAISPLYPIPYDYYTWHRASSNPDYAHRVRGYVIYYPSSIEVAIELMDLKTGQWKAIIKSATGSAAAYSKYFRDVSPDGEIIVFGHDNAQLHPYAEYYIHIRKVANPAQKVIVTIPEPLESLRFNEDLSITVNGLYTYDRNGQPWAL